MLKTKIPFAILIIMLISLSFMASVASAQTVQTNAMMIKLDVAPSNPAVNIIYPADGGVLEFGTHQIIIDTAGAVKVEIKIDGAGSTNGWVDITASGIDGHYYSYDWSVDIEGSSSITARAINLANKRGGDTVTVTVVASTEPPTSPVYDVAITSVSASPTSVIVGAHVTITVDAANQGTQTATFTVKAFAGSIVVGEQMITLAAGGTQTLTYDWITSIEGTFTISAVAGMLSGETDTTDNSRTDSTVIVSASGTPPTATYTLFIEIDYMIGHEPTQEVLAYMQTYYAQRDIAVVYEIATTPVPLDTSVSTREFWRIEAQYNTGPDSANGNSNNGKYNIPYKWVLFGTTVSGSPNTVGYTYCIGNSIDLLAGNYIYIADLTADNWAGSSLKKGAEAVVLMHEFGHSIGIAELSSTGAEVYCDNYYCVMSLLRVQNAGNTNAWYYCADHWATRNMNYYVS